VVRESAARLGALAESSLAGVRAAKDAVIAHSAQRRAEMEGLQDYLYANVYRHPRVTRIMGDAETIVRDLFARYMTEPGEMLGPWGAAGSSDDAGARALVVADFVAGMTDRFAIKEHRRLFDATPELR
jgi:dGTPase